MYQDDAGTETENSHSARKVWMYRSRNGACFGVCEGLARYFNFSIFWTRVMVVIATICSGIWPGVCMYVLAALMMKLEPVIPLESPEEEEFYYSYSGSRSMALHRLKRIFDSLERRIQRIEATVTSREYEWERRLNE